MYNCVYSQNKNKHFQIQAVNKILYINLTVFASRYLIYQYK